MHHAQIRSQLIRRPLARLLPLLGLSLTGHAYAAEIQLGEWKGDANTAVTMGTLVRAEEPDEKLIFKPNGATRGMRGNPLTAQNNDDGNLNFKRGDQVSTVLKALGELRLKRDNSEVLLRAKAWYDYALENNNRQWGNFPNQYEAGKPLSDDGFSRLASFSGIALMDAYVGQRFLLNDQSADLRIGNQSLQQWGERSSLGGGLAAITPVDAAAARRPGVLPGESAIPVPQVTGRWQFTRDQSVEAFYQFAFRHSELPGCGTYFSGIDYVAEGCNAIFPGGASTDRAKLAANNYVKRVDTLEPDDRGQFGLAYRFRLESLGGNLGLHFAQYHNRLPNIGVLKSTRATPYIPGDADGQNVRYLTEYADKVRVWGLSFDSKVGNTSLFGELTYRPNQPLGLNGTDILNAFLSNTAPTLLRQDAINTPAGSLYHGFDRRRMLQLQIAAARPFKNVLAADSVTLAGEIGVRHFPGLPDVSERRYGRSTAFGGGPVNGACQTGATDVMCSDDGYVTGTAWGYRLRASARYPGLLAGADFIPTIAFGQDVKGWSHDGTFNEGRKTVSLSMRGEYQKRYFADLTYVAIHGGDYDELRDRDYVSLAVGYSF